jgi:hypothetical protein
VFELVGAGIEKALGEAVEHEGVVGVGGVAQAEEFFWHGSYSIAWIAMNFTQGSCGGQRALAADCYDVMRIIRFNIPLWAPYPPVSI